MSTTSGGINGVGTVFVPVTDQDRSLSFYVGKLGFEKCSDFPYGAGRWLEVAPPGSAHRVALVPLGEGKAGDGRRTYCAFETKNVDETHVALRRVGVEVSDIARKGKKRTGLFSEAVTIPDPVPPQFFLRDPDGNQFLIVEVR
jgi:catechol 2,3-dioxygenase-like lactoylglutathione lyase family enzyme